jgi:hypothetical protein
MIAKIFFLSFVHDIKVFYLKGVSRERDESKGLPPGRLPRPPPRRPPVLLKNARTQVLPEFWVDV